MSDAETPKYRGPQSEDVVFRAVNDSPYYGFEANGPVDFAPVSADHELLGFIWWQNDQSAADFVPARSAQGRGQNAGVRWNQALASAKAQGKSAEDAVRHLAAGAGVPGFGTLELERREAANGVDAVMALAER